MIASEHIYRKLMSDAPPHHEFMQIIIYATTIAPMICQQGCSKLQQQGLPT